MHCGLIRITAKKPGVSEKYGSRSWSRIPVSLVSVSDCILIGLESRLDRSEKAAGAIIQAFYFSDPVPLFLVYTAFYFSDPVPLFLVYTAFYFSDPVPLFLVQDHFSYK